MWSIVRPLTLVWLWLLMSLPAFAQQTSIQVVPADPTTNDVVSIRMSGLWPNACVPRNPQVTSAGSQIHIATSNPGTLCLTQVTPWELTASLGRLAAGTYTVSVTYNGQSIGSIRFTVAEGGSPPPGGCDLRAVISVNRGCGAVYRIGEGIAVQFRAESANYTQALVTVDDVLPTGAVQRIFHNWVPTNQTLTINGFIAPPTGQETLRITAQAGACAGSGSCSFMVSSSTAPPPSGPTLTVSPTTVAPGSTLAVSWSGVASPPARVWLGLYRSGSAHSEYLSYWFTNGGSSGHLSVTLPASLGAGTYELRMFPSGSYSLLATSNAFVVTSTPTARDFIVNVAGERFVIRLVTAEQIATARAILAGALPQRIVSGQLADGNGGYNRDVVSGRVWSWRLIPETIAFVELSAEALDGRPSDIERDRSYWLDNLGWFAPWASRLEREVTE